MNGLPAAATPLTAALWLARCQRDHLLGVEGSSDFLRWRSSLEPSEVERTLAVCSALVRIWVAAARAELGPIDERQPGAWLERASTLVLRHVLRAFDVDFEGERQLYPDMHAEYFFEGTGSRLLRGLANCDVYSHLLALVLRGWTRAEVIGVPGHQLVRVPGFPHGRRLVTRLLGFGSTVYVDGYSELPPFVLEREPLGLATLDQLEARVAERDRRYRERGKSPGEPLRPARVYAEARSIPLPRERASRWPASLDPPDLSAGSASRDRVGIYFEARAHHLFGSPELALSLYRSIAGSEGDQPGWIGTLRSAARHFADRLKP